MIKNYLVLLLFGHVLFLSDRLISAILWLKYANGLISIRHRMFIAFVKTTILLQTAQINFFA